MSTLADSIQQLLQPLATTMGLSVGHVRLYGKQIPGVQIFLEKIDTSGVILDECAKFAKQARVIMDVNEVFQNQVYNLEVSSFGIDRPLFTPADYVKFTGQNITIKTKYLVGDAKKIAGKLKELNGLNVVIETDNQTLNIPLEAIDRAHLDIVKNININKIK